MAMAECQTHLELREPPADGRAKYWGKSGTVKFYVPTGKKEDGPWTQDVCWKGALSREFQIAKNKKFDIEAGNDIEAIMRTKAFLRHAGASRDSQRSQLNTRRQKSSEGGSVHSIMPSRGSKSTARSQTKQVLHGLLADNRELKNEFQELRQIFVATEKRIKDLER